MFARPTGQETFNDFFHDRGETGWAAGKAGGLWFLAHRHGQLRGLVDANKNGIDDKLETPVKEEGKV